MVFPWSKSLPWSITDGNILTKICIKNESIRVWNRQQLHSVPSDKKLHSQCSDRKLDHKLGCKWNKQKRRFVVWFRDSERWRVQKHMVPRRNQVRWALLNVSIWKRWAILIQGIRERLEANTVNNPKRGKGLLCDMGFTTTIHQGSIKVPRVWKAAPQALGQSAPIRWLKSDNSWGAQINVNSKTNWGR